MNEINQYPAISPLFTMAFAGVVMINMVCCIVAIVLKYSGVLRVSGASLIASLTTSWFSWIPLMVLFPSQKLEAGWLAGIVILVLLIVYVLWLFIFQPRSIENMLKVEFYKKKKKRIHPELKQARSLLSNLDKKSADYENTLLKIDALKKELFDAKLDTLSRPLKFIGKKLCTNSK